MRERVGDLVGPPARAAWVMTFHAACGRILRREAQRLGYRSNFTIYDQRRPDPAREALPRGARARPEALHAARHPLADLEREEHAGQPGGVHRPRRELLRPDRRRGLRPLPEAPLRLERRRLRRHALPHRRRARALPRGAREVAGGVPLHPRRRVPGHEPRAVPTSCSCSPRSTTNVFAVGDPDQSIYGFRGADIRNVLEFEHDFPGSYTIALEQNYRSTQHILDAANGVISHNRERKEKNLWSELGDGDPVRVDRGRGRARRGALRRRRDRAARRGGLLRQRGRRLLPHERAEPRARGRARAPGHRVPGDRRAALLRARRDQGPRRLPPGARQPVRRRLAAAHRQPAAPRHRRLDARAAPDLGRPARDLALGGDGRGRDGRRRRGAAEGARTRSAARSSR